MLPFYDNDLSAALSDLFPDIGIDKEKFRENKISQKLQNRRKSFEDFAIHHNFDPKNPWNWYNQPRHKITAWFVATKVLSSLFSPSFLSAPSLCPLPLPTTLFYLLTSTPGGLCIATLPLQCLSRSPGPLPHHWPGQGQTTHVTLTYTLL